MKYIKKPEFQNIKHNLRSDRGELIILESNYMNDDELYERNKFMFDIVEEELEIIENIIEEEIINEVVEIEIEEILKKDILDELSECFTIEQIYELAEENEISLDRRIKNIKKLKEFFQEEFESK